MVDFSRFGLHAMMKGQPRLNVKHTPRFLRLVNFFDRCRISDD